MTNALHPTEQSVFTKHYDSMMASLSRRLEVARADNNTQLVALLEQEKQQVTRDTALLEPEAGPQRWWKALSQRVGQALRSRSGLQVSEIVDGSDRWWVAFDPQTGQLVYADSEAELRLWIEENYQGK